MDAREFCRKTYRDYIQRAPIPTELKRSLRTHERVPAFIDNLAKELLKVNSKVKRENLVTAVESMTGLFINAVHRQAEEKAMSPIKKMMLKQDADRKKKFQKAANLIERKGSSSVIQSAKGETTQSKVTLTDKETNEILGDIDG